MYLQDKVLICSVVRERYSTYVYNYISLCVNILGPRTDFVSDSYDYKLYDPEIWIISIAKTLKGCTLFVVLYNPL